MKVNIRNNDSSFLRTYIVEIESPLGIYTLESVMTLNEATINKSQMEKFINDHFIISKPIRHKKTKI